MALTPPGPQCTDCWLLIMSGYQGRCDTGTVTWLSLLPGLLGSQDRRAGSDWLSPGCCAGVSQADGST